MFKCCNIAYKKSDIETYWCIDTFTIKPLTKRFVNNQRIFSEVVESCICKKCGCQLVQVKRFGRKNGRKSILEVEEFRADAADLFLIENQKRMQLQPQICPMPLIASATTMPSVYGYAIAPDKQRARYNAALSEKDSWRNKWENGKWVPDIFHSECRIVKDA